MGTGWKRAFCTAITKERESPTTAAISADKQNTHSSSCHGQPKNPTSPNPSPRSCVRLSFLSGGSNPSTPRLQRPQSANNSPTLRCRTSSAAIQQTHGGWDNQISPNLKCKTVTTTSTPKSSAKSLGGSNPASPRSPFSILKHSLRLSRSNCGVCMQSVKSGQGMAIYTAECSHAFHFPCISTHVGNNGSLVCPVCKSAWKDVPLLAIHKVQPQPHPEQESDNKIQNKDQTKTKIHHVKMHHMNSRGYDDDEPLASPTATARFVPIPEVNEEEEEEEEDVEEFKGFFVNPISSSSDEAFIGGRDTRNVEVSLMPEAAVVSTGRTHEAHVVVLRIKAPPPPPPSSVHCGGGGSANLLDRSRRAPIDLVAVLDVSGSMTGSKLQMMKRAIRLVISSLGSSDRLSIIAFSSSPKRLLPLRRMTAQGQLAARRIIDRLGCSQGSSVGEALKKAAKVLEDRRERNPVASIMLLSDGQDDNSSANSNDQDQRHTSCSSSSSHVSSTRFSHVEIPVHAFGFGGKQKKSGYIHEPAEDKFTKCVGGLLSVVVHDLKLQLSIGSGSDPAEVAAVYSSEGKPVFIGSSSIKIGDLYAEEERELLVELRVPTPAVGSHHVLSVRCSYRDPATKELINGRDHALLVPRSQVVGAYNNSPVKIQRLRNLFITTRAIAESRRLIEHNDLNTAHHLLSSAQALIVRSSSLSPDEYISALDAELAGLRWRRELMERRRSGEKEVVLTDENGEPLTPTTAWRAAERLAKVAMMKKSLNRVSDLHGFENARF